MAGGWAMEELEEVGWEAVGTAVAARVAVGSAEGGAETVWADQAV